MQSTSEAQRQKQYYNRKANGISLQPGNLVLAKDNAYRGKRKVQDWWEEEPYEMEFQAAEASLPTLVGTRRQDTHESSTKTNFSHNSYRGDSTLYGHAAKVARCTTTTLEEQTPEGSETEEASQSANWPLPA